MVKTIKNKLEIWDLWFIQILGEFPIVTSFKQCPDRMELFGRFFLGCVIFN